MKRDEYLVYARLNLHKKRIDRSLRVIEKTLRRSSAPYVAYSTGKDSGCVLDMVLQQKADTPAVYFDADCALPESLLLLEQFKSAGVFIEKWPTEPLLKTIKRFGLEHPKLENETMKSTVYTPAKRLLTERGYDGVFLGLRAEESSGRSKMGIAYGELYRRKRDGILVCNPILWWKTEDVWAYILSNNLPYNKAYDYPGIERISYWAGETNITRGRWVYLKKYWPDLFNKLASEFPEASSYT